MKKKSNSVLDVHKKMDYYTTTLGQLDGVEIIEPGDIEIGDEDSFYIYWHDEVRYCMSSSSEHNGTVDSIKNLIKNNPDEEVIIYRYSYLSNYYEFVDVVKRMNELTTAIQRDNKLSSILANKKG